MTSADWYVVHVAHGRDDKARETLKRLGVEFYCPMLRERRSVPRMSMSRLQRASGLRLTREHLSPLFPRYLFVRIDPARGWRAEFDEAGIEGLVTAGKSYKVPGPVRFAAEVIDDLRSREVDGAIPGDTPAAVIFRVDEKIKIVDGVLAGQAARIVAMPSLPIGEFDSTARLSVAVSLLGRVHSVELPIDQVVKLVTA